MFHPAEMELNETTKLILDRVSELNPKRVVIDSLSELRLLAHSPLRYRRQVLALKHYFTSRQCTVILLDDLSSQQNDLQLHSIAHGVVLLEQTAIDYGAERRRLRSSKMRGAKLRGYRDFIIEKGRLHVFPGRSQRITIMRLRRSLPRAASQNSIRCWVVGSNGDKRPFLGAAAAASRRSR